MRHVAGAVCEGARSGRDGLVSNADLKYAIKYVKRFIFVKVLMKWHAFPRRAFDKHPADCANRFLSKWILCKMCGPDTSTIAPRVSTFPRNPMGAESNDGSKGAAIRPR